MTITVAAVALVYASHEQRVWLAYQRKLFAAHTLYFREIDQLHENAVTEYWAMKPDKFKFREPDGTVTLSIGEKGWRKRADGDWEPIDFQREGSLSMPGAFGGFWVHMTADMEMDVIGSPKIVKYLGKRVKTFEVKTSESAIFFGTDRMLYSTGQPIGHYALERNDVTTNSTYDKVKLNIKVSKSEFAQPGHS